jgi:hypothetical protein
MLYVINANLYILGAEAILAVLCLCLDKYFGKFQIIDLSKKRTSFELLYFALLKTLSVFYFAHIFFISLSSITLVYLSLPYIFLLPSELSTAVLVLEIFIIFSTIFAIVKILNKNTDKPTSHIPITPQTEPLLFNLIDELSEYYSVPQINDVYITPGAELDIVENVHSLDDIFYGGSKKLVVGLSALQFLTASDFKVLLTRQFALHSTIDESGGLFVKRLIRRLEILVTNINNNSGIFTFVPVAWFAYLGQIVFSNITNGYTLLLELRADEETADYCGTNQLKVALSRYNVETEMLKETIAIVSSQSIDEHKDLGHIYQSIKKARFKPDDEVAEIVKYLFNDEGDYAALENKRSLKLRLKRLPETAVSEPDIKHPAYTYLDNWVQTENRMVRIIGNNPNLYLEQDKSNTV